VVAAAGTLIFPLSLSLPPSQVTVTYKKFGRKYVVPADQAPEVPTAAERKRIASKGRYLKGLRALAQTPAAEPEASPGFLFATTAKDAAKTREERARKALERAGLARGKEGAGAAAAGAAAAAPPS
jgi:hypothetical protein